MANTYKITRLLMLMALLFGAVSAASAANSFSAIETTLTCGQTGDLEFSLTGDEPVYGVQAEIQLPKGLEFFKVDGKPVLTVSKDIEELQITCNLVSESSMKIALFSTKHVKLSGVLLTVNVIVSEDFRGGKVSVSNVILTDSNNYDKEDVVDSETSLGYKIPVESIILDKTELSLTEGDSEPLTATVAPENATDKTVTWTSSDEAVATVDATGKVTAIAAGTATITATSANGKTATCSVTVTAKVIAVTAITLDKTELSLTEGETATLTATVAPENATDKTVTWTSSNIAIATVDATGKVTAIAEGTATITATAAGGKTATCAVTVTAKAPEVIEVTSITLNKTELNLTEGETATLTATIAPDNATDKTVRWTTSDPTVASVDENGKVTAIAAGTATITATSANGKSASCTVTVLPILVETLTIDPTVWSIEQGSTFKLRLQLLLPTRLTRA